MALLIPGCLGEAPGFQVLAFLIDYWLAPRVNYYGHFMPLSATSTSHPHLHFLWYKEETTWAPSVHQGDTSARSFGLQEANSSVSLSPAHHPFSDPALLGHYFKMAGMFSLWIRPLDTKSERDASALSVSSPRAGGTAVDSHILEALSLSFSLLPLLGQACFTEWQCGHCPEACYKCLI